MTSGVTYLDPAPAPSELPAQFPSPFEPVPHPIARRAAEALLGELARGLPGIDLSALDTQGGSPGGGGKMFGVLVVADPAGRIGYLRAFSGMLDGRWVIDGYAPPLFDPAAREAMWPAGQATLRDYELRLRALDHDAAYLAVQAALVTARAEAAAASEALRAQHRERRARRHGERSRLDASGLSAEELQRALHALDQESRADTAERRRLDAAHAAPSALEERAGAFAAQRAELERLRADESRDLMKQVHDTYVIASARGERRPLRELFAPGEPPGGAGDCAAPKLLGEAYRRALRPIALAEVWWGAPPLIGGRHARSFYPACRGKCGAILPHMLAGLAAAEAPAFGARVITEREPRTVFEDAWLVVVDKPIELLSVPGRSGALRDSVQTRLRQRYPDATGPLVVHRLDLDTSGLLLAAKDRATHTALQALFARREVDKRYVAWLDGVVREDRGVIELALRVDLDDRPRQIHDPVHGKAAVTEWLVLERGPRATKVALFPRTGRTHQLRVHAAHPLGLDAPIVGDRLYGRSHRAPAGPDVSATPGPSASAHRMLLHAAHLAFVHPHTGERVEVDSPPPF